MNSYLFGGYNKLIRILRNSKPRIIGIDGATDSGKSCLAKRISDELHYVVLEFDNFRSSLLMHNGLPSYELDSRDIKLIQEVGTLILERRRNIIIEGVLLLKMSEKIGFSIDFFVYCQNKKRERHITDELQGYNQEYNPSERANYIYSF